MARLTVADRANLAAEFMRQNSDPIAVLKPDIRAAVNAGDDALDAIDASLASIVSALPMAFRQGTSVTQRRLFIKMLLKERIDKGA